MRRCGGPIALCQDGEAIVPDPAHRMSGSRILVRTLDQGGDFGLIRRLLDEIARWLETIAKQRKGSHRMRLFGENSR